MRLSTLILSGLLPASLAASLPSYGPSKVSWNDCPSHLNPNASAHLHCGYLDVPLDWDEPSKHEPVKIGFVKIPARDPKNRIGSLFYNPGGPGDQASQILASALFGSGSKLHPEIWNRFDVIGMDLRGTGLSDKVNCNRTLYNTRLPLYPSDEISYQKMIDRNVAFRESCLQMTGRPLIDFMDTISIVKDYEAIRQALGSGKITYLGQSYGTLLGSQWAELFPDVFRAILLDGPFSNSPSETTQFITSASAVDAALEKFFEWCSKQNSTYCPIAQQNRTIKATWTDLMDQAEKTPIPAPHCTPKSAPGCMYPDVTATQMRQATLNQLYQPSTSGFLPLAELAYGIYNASVRNDASYFASVTLGVDRDMSLYAATYLLANTAISCQDDAHVTSPSDMELRAKMASTQTPLLMGASVEYAVFVRNCAGWPQPKRNPPHVINIPDSKEFPTVLLVTNLWDPATPNPMATNLQYEIGINRTRLLTREALGHTVLFQEDAYYGPTLAAMNRYLLELELPEQGTVYGN